MAVTTKPNAGTGALSRRAALLAPLALAGCETIDGWLGSKKAPLTGKREAVRGDQRALTADTGMRKIILPAPVRNAGWPQAGGNPAHMMGHLAVADGLSRAWASSIGEGGGYRRKILAQPVVENGVVFAMDSAGDVSAFTLSDGNRLWRFETANEDADARNIGGGLGVDQGTVYAANGLGDIVALDAAKGTLRWRQSLGAPARSAPTIAEGRLFITTIEDRLVALATDDGRSLWSYRGEGAGTALLGQPAPAFSRGLVVTGFGSGVIAAVRAETGSVAWTDGLGGTASLRSGVVDFTAIRGAPVIVGGIVYATGMGGLTAAIDLPTGRRIWERQVGGQDTLCLAGDWVFMVSLDQEMLAIDANDGRIAWISPLPRWATPEKRKDPLTWYGPILAADRLVVTGNSEEALSISPYTGAILGRQPLSAAASPVSPVVADGTLLVVSDDARLLALR